MKRRSALGTLLVILGAVGLAYAFLSVGQSPLAAWIPGFREEVHIERTVEADNLDSIKVESGSTNVRIVQGSGDQVRATLAGRASKRAAEKLTLDADARDNRLDIVVNRNSGFSIGVSWTSVSLTVEVPDKLWNELSINGGSSNIKLEDLNSQDIQLRTGSGNVAIDNTTANVLETKIGSGNLKLNRVHGGRFDLQTSSGNITVDKFEAERIAFNVSSGNVKLKDGIAELDGRTSSGNIELDAEDLLRHATLSAGSGNVTVKLDRTPESLAVSFRGGSGNGRIQKDGFRYENTRDRSDVEGAFGSGEIKLKVETRSGNFTLK